MPLKGTLAPHPISVFSASQLSWYEQPCPTQVPFSPGTQLYPRPKVGPSSYGLKPPKAWAKINSYPLKTDLSSVVCPTDRNQTHHLISEVESKSWLAILQVINWSIQEIKNWIVWLIVFNQTLTPMACSKTPQSHPHQDQAKLLRS